LAGQPRGGDEKAERDQAQHNLLDGEVLHKCTLSVQGRGWEERECALNCSVSAGSLSNEGRWREFWMLNF
jgi:hypothetical protein